MTRDATKLVGADLGETLFGLEWGGLGHWGDLESDNRELAVPSVLKETQGVSEAVDRSTIDGDDCATTQMGAPIGDSGGRAVGLAVDDIVAT